jgi:hypothetical protein
MTNNEMEKFIDSLNTVFHLGLYIGDTKTAPWVKEFSSLSYTVAATMISLYYTHKNEHIDTITPKALLEFHSEAVNKIVEPKYNGCEMCYNTGMINVKHFDTRYGYLDYAYGCICSNAIKGLTKLTKEDIMRFRQIQHTPARFIDMNIYSNGQKTGEQITNEQVLAVTAKRYSKEAIARFKEKRLKEINERVSAFV